MADLVAQELWSAVHELGIGEPVQGGPGGVDNQPHQQLLNRVEFLRKRIGVQGVWEMPGEGDPVPPEDAADGKRYVVSGTGVFAGKALLTGDVVEFYDSLATVFVIPASIITAAEVDALIEGKEYAAIGGSLDATAEVMWIRQDGIAYRVAASDLARLLGAPTTLPVMSGGGLAVGDNSEATAAVGLGINVRADQGSVIVGMDTNGLSGQWFTSVGNGNSLTGEGAVVVGIGSTGDQYSVVAGYGSSGTYGSVAVGAYATVGLSAVGVGTGAYVEGIASSSYDGGSNVAVGQSAYVLRGCNGPFSGYGKVGLGAFVAPLNACELAVPIRRYGSNVRGHMRDIGACAQTTGATPSNIAVGGNQNPSEDHYLVNLPVSSAGAFVALVSAYQAAGSAGTVGDSAAFRVEGLIKRTPSGISFVGTPTVTSIGADAGAAAWSVGGFFVSSGDYGVGFAVTGEADKTIVWSSRIISVTTG